ncbi:MAG TPA: FG-GAP-like repeat-containing protein, partial [Urbifossiella sp.]|nr:FG-GAP-like repeat-containing protein [Urbifossiella sp.]
MRYRVLPYGGQFTGGVHVAVVDVNRDGELDLVTSPGPGTGSVIRAFDGRTGFLLADIPVFGGVFFGGVNLAAGDIDGDGWAELVASADDGGGPRVTIYSFPASGPSRIADFFGIDDPSFRGGARTAVGDINGDGRAEVVVAAGIGGGPRISVYDGAALAAGRHVHPVSDFFLFEQELRNGAYVALGDLDGDGAADLVGGGGPGGGPRVLALSGQLLLTGGPAAALGRPLGNFFAGDNRSREGARVAVLSQGLLGVVDVATSTVSRRVLGADGGWTMLNGVWIGGFVSGPPAVRLPERENRAPTSVPQALTLPEDTVLRAAAQVSDPDGDRVTVAVRTRPLHGDLSITPDGSITY